MRRKIKHKNNKKNKKKKTKKLQQQMKCKDTNKKQ